MPYKNIDKQKWDDCINNSFNSLIYARSVYLDHMCPSGWDAFILNDYDAVMPLTSKKKYGVNYLYQPAFVQQAGIFYKDKSDSQTCNAFIEKLITQFKFAEIPLNYLNQDFNLPGNSKITQHINYILNLQPGYEKLYANYHPSFTKSLRRLKKFGLQYARTTGFEAAINLYNTLYGKRLPYFSQQDFLNFKSLCSKLALENNVITREAYSSENKLLAAVVLLKDKNRLYNIISAITPEGKKLETNYFLYDKIIEEFARRPLLLDLEGSDVEGIADFYKKFNPENQPYPHLKFNNLHPFIKLFKK